MNLILLNPNQFRPDGTAELTGRSADHVRSQLHGAMGQRLRIGVLNGPRGTGTIQRITETAIELVCSLEPEPPPRPSMSLLLALPRPKVLKRLWAQLAALGLGRIYLCNAAKVERSYFDTHWLSPKHYEPLLIEGLEQAEDTRLPEVRVIRRLKPFLEDELAGLFPAEIRILAHPASPNPHTPNQKTPQTAGDAGGPRFKTLSIFLEGRAPSRPSFSGGNPGPVASNQSTLLAVGPEGGWTDYELAMFEQLGFNRFSLGPRKLRSDTACLTLLGALMALVPGQT